MPLPMTYDYEPVDDNTQAWLRHLDNQLAKKAFEALRTALKTRLHDRAEIELVVDLMARFEGYVTAMASTQDVVDHLSLPLLQASATARAQTAAKVLEWVNRARSFQDLPADLSDHDWELYLGMVGPYDNEEHSQRILGAAHYLAAAYPGYKARYWINRARMQYVGELPPFRY